MTIQPVGHAPRGGDDARPEAVGFGEDAAPFGAAGRVKLTPISGGRGESQRGEAGRANLRVVRDED